MKLRNVKFACAMSLTLFATVAKSHAGELAERIESGKSIRIGFAYEEPYAYPDGSGQPAGFVNAYTIGLLHEMGHDNVEPVVMDWGGLIPALQSGRVDMITGGLYILKARCDTVEFSEPIAKVTNGFIVQKGNPKGLTNYRDIATKSATMVTGVGYSPIIDGAKNDGVADANIMQVPGPSEILAAVLAGRADVGVAGYPTVRDLERKSGVRWMSLILMRCPRRSKHGWELRFGKPTRTFAINSTRRKSAILELQQ